MPIRLTGMNSGLDTEALVSELVSAYRKKTDKYVKAQTKLTWKQDAWKSLSAKTYSFRTSLDSMRMSSSYKLKTTSVSNSTKATVKASNKAVNGSQSLNITSLAKAGYLTGGKLKRKDGKAVAGDTTLAALGYDAGKSGKIKLNGKEITLDSTTTINDVVSKLNGAGVTASFDATNQRIFVNSNSSGAASDFKLEALEGGAEALKTLGLYVKSEATTEAYKSYAEEAFKLANLGSGVTYENWLNQKIEDYKQNQADYASYQEGGSTDTFEKWLEDKEYSQYTAGGGTDDRKTWLETRNENEIKAIGDKLKDYNTASDTITKGNQADSFLKAAADYKTALDKLASVKDGVETGSGIGIGWDDAKKLLEDSGKYVDADGKVYSLSVDRDANGRSYYTIDGDSSGDKYYFATESRQVESLDKDGNPIKDQNGNPVTETKTFAIIRTEAEANAGSGGKDVSTSTEYLKEKGLTDEMINGYRDAQSAVSMFNAAVQSEEDTYNNRLAALEKEFTDALPAGATPDQIAEAKANAKTQADAELKATGSYADWRSLKSLKEKVDGGSMAANEIKAAQNTVEADRTAAQQVVEENAFFVSYAREYETNVATGTEDEIAKKVFNDISSATETLVKEQAGFADYSEGAVRIDGQDATIYLNGAQYTSSSNTFNINGLTITALATTTTEDKIGTPEADATAVTITTATDNQGIYDKIKDFLSGYNDLINLMTGSYNAASAKDYEPLTDEEREAMTESQIEKWEERGKSAVLRRDGTLSALMSTLTSAMSQSFEINGKKYSLSTFGIKTLGILNAEKNEQNAYHIDGDEDDENVSGNTDKLMAAIMEDPDAVTDFFQLLTHNMSLELGKKMSSTTMRTYGTFYNDKEMAKEYSDYTTTIAKWEKKVASIEDSYYKKFAAMEKALATLQSQSSQLAGLLG